MATLHELVSPDAIRLDVPGTDWRAAITAAGDLLVESGVSEATYTRSMISNVEEHGPYIVVAPGFAFAHARGSANTVHRTGMSWLRLAEPVAFGHESNDPVTLVAALAAPDSSAHMQAMRQLAALLGDPKARDQLNRARTPQEFLAVLHAASSNTSTQTNDDDAATPGRSASDSARSSDETQPTGHRKTTNHILTVCGNGLGTSLFLKNTLEQVLDQWGWSPYLTVEATDTISARGKSKDADLILTSGEIARTLGDVGIPVKVITNFTSTDELDAALGDSYDV